MDLTRCALMGCTVRLCRLVFAYTRTRWALVATMPYSCDENEKGFHYSHFYHNFGAMRVSSVRTVSITD
jgi:hypothetical protein